MSKVLIIGESGSGKSASMRNLKPENTIIIQVHQKELPFRHEFKKLTKEGGSITICSSASQMVAIIKKLTELKATKTIIIDDFQYLMGFEFMDRAYENGYDKFIQIGRHAFEVLVAADNYQGRVYFLTHEEVEDGKTRMLTLGKMLRQTIVPEGLFTIVLRAQCIDGKYVFSVANDGSTVVKAPIGMFESETIDNDLALVDKIINQYYSQK